MDGFLMRRIRTIGWLVLSVGQRLQSRWLRGEIMEDFRGNIVRHGDLSVTMYSYCVFMKGCH